MFRLDKHLAVLLTASSHGLAFREVRITRHALRPADLIDDACSRVTRNLTIEELTKPLQSRPACRTMAN